MFCSVGVFFGAGPQNLLILTFILFRYIKQGSKSFFQSFSCLQCQAVRGVPDNAAAYGTAFIVLPFFFRGSINDFAFVSLPAQTFFIISG